MTHLGVRWDGIPVIALDLLAASQVDDRIEHVMVRERLDHDGVMLQSDQGRVLLYALAPDGEMRQPAANLRLRERVVRQLQPFEPIGVPGVFRNPYLFASAIERVPYDRLLTDPAAGLETTPSHEF